MTTRIFRSSPTHILFSPTKETITERKIKQFANYHDGWSFGRGLKFTNKVIEKSIEVFKMFHSYGFIETNAFPGENGEIMITAYKNNYCCEVVAYQDGSYDFIIEKDDEEVKCVDKANADLIKQNIKEFRDQFVWNSSESSTQSISTLNVKGSPDWLSRIVATKEEFRLLTTIAHEH